MGSSFAYIKPEWCLSGAGVSTMFEEDGRAKWTTELASASVFDFGTVHHGRVLSLQVDA